jgi:hypothetical protein
MNDLRRAIYAAANNAPDRGTALQRLRQWLGLCRLCWEDSIGHVAVNDTEYPLCGRHLNEWERAL